MGVQPHCGPKKFCLFHNCAYNVHNYATCTVCARTFQGPVFVFVTSFDLSMKKKLPSSIQGHQWGTSGSTNIQGSLIKKRQTAFTRDGKDSASYRLLRNIVQWEVKSAKYDYYHHNLCDLDQADPKKKSGNKQVIDRSGYTLGMVPSIPARKLSRQ